MEGKFGFDELVVVNLRLQAELDETMAEMRKLKEELKAVEEGRKVGEGIDRRLAKGTVTSMSSSTSSSSLSGSGRKSSKGGTGTNQSNGGNGGGGGWNGKGGQTRYWTRKEHGRFLKALEVHCAKDVRAIAEFVGSRSPTQVRTHAQKYFMRLSREQQQQQQRKEKHASRDDIDNNNDILDTDMRGTDGSSSNSTTSHDHDQNSNPTTSTTTTASAAAAAAAALNVPNRKPSTMKDPPRLTPSNGIDRKSVV